ncbi:MAG: hypothetical protein RL139_575 [Gemmatimonadota bacterium]
MGEAALGARMRAWCAGRWWWWRAPLFLALALPVVRPLRAEGEWTLFSGIIFGAHEFGHLFWMPFGEWMGVAGGSLTQLLIPLGAAALMIRSGDWFGLAATGCFTATSLAELSWYVQDARTQALPLVSFSEEGAIHDWGYLLESAGWLAYDVRIAAMLRGIGWVLLLASWVLALRLCWWMAASRPAGR